MTGHLRAVFEALSIDQAHVIAQSMGGRIALQYTHENPSRVRSLALLGSVGFGEVLRIAKLAPLVPAPSPQLIRRWMIKLGEKVVYGRRAPIDPSFIDAYWAPTQFPGFIAAARQGLIEFDWTPVSREFLSGISAPALLLFGSLDRIVRPVHAESLAPALPNGRMHWVRGAGHVVNEEAYDEVNPMLLEFIRDHA
jgi:pimeloyl-ACP methyl ester carboxylesterase